MKRSYRQNCALAHALDLVGERWTLLIVRELLIGPRRYGELLDNLRGIGTNLLAGRLREMESRGLVEKRAQTYSLTASGQRLEPVVFELVRFGLTLEIEDMSQWLKRPEWDVVALSALYRPSDDALQGRYIIELNGEPFCIEAVGRDGVRVTAGECDTAEVRIGLTKSVARQLGSGDITFVDATREGLLNVKGSKLEARRLLRSFGMLP